MPRRYRIIGSSPARSALTTQQFRRLGRRHAGSDWIELLWEISMPLLKSPPPVQIYKPGSWGPRAIDKLTAPFRWYLPDAGR
jgi:glucose-6-phosphate 1-dehydrogenase